MTQARIAFPGEPGAGRQRQGESTGSQGALISLRSDPAVNEGGWTQEKHMTSDRRSYLLASEGSTRAASVTVFAGVEKVEFEYEA